MAQSLSNFDNALKNVYGPGIRNAINSSNPVLTSVVHDTENVSGRKCIWSVHSGRSSAVGARPEGGALPTADYQRTLAPEETLAYLYGTIEVSGQALHLTQNSAGAFAKALEFEMKHLVKDVKADLARQMFNSKVTINSVLASGALSRSVGTPTTTITLEDLASTSGGSPDPAVFRYFEEGMKIDFVTPSTGAVSVAGVTVSAVDSAAGTLTTSTASGAADDDYIFRAGNWTATGTENEINGLPFLLGTQNYAGITAASNARWNGRAVGSTSAGISENLLASAVEEVQVNGSGDKPSLAISSFKQGRKLASVFQTQKRYEPKPTTITGGWEGVEVAGLNLVFDRFAPERKVFLISPGELAWFVGHDWDWDTDDGQVLNKKTGYDAITAQYKAYVQLNTYTRNAHAIVTVADPTF